MSTQTAFTPAGYEPPVNGGGFTKLENGDNRFRVLSSPLMIWLIWADGKPKRIPFNRDQKPVKGAGPKDAVKHAWGLIVWNYTTEKIEVFELDKQDIIANLYKYGVDPDWGHPKNYDIVINKSGSGMDTTYSFVAKPAKPVIQEIITAFTENPVDLSRLLTGENPFLGSSTTPPPANKSAAPTAKIVTPENWVDGDAIPTGYKISDAGGIEKDLPF